MSDASERMTRSRIRDRLREGMLDLNLLLRHMDPSDIQTALESRVSTADDMPAEAELRDGLASAIGVVYLACRDRQGTAQSPEESDNRIFLDCSDRGVRIALNRLGMTVDDVETTLDIDMGTPFPELGTLPPAELATYSMEELFHAKDRGDITKEQFDLAVEEKFTL